MGVTKKPAFVTYMAYGLVALGYVLVFALFVI